MFWQFENWTASQIDKILDSPDRTLDQVLGEDDVIQECKSQNEKLLQFLLKEDVMRQMINLVITVPDESLDPKLRFKKANVACELLTCDLDLINDALIQEDHLKALYSFIETSSNNSGETDQSQVVNNQELNPLLASFVSKTFCVLITRRPQGLFNFLKTKETFVTDILSHIEVSAMTDFLLRLMTGIEDQEIKDTVDSWLNEKRLIPSLIDFIDQTSHRPESQFNATQLLCDFIRICREQQSMLQEKANPNPLLQAIESSEAVDKILRLMFESNTECGIVQGIRILQSLIEYKKHNANLNQPPGQLSIDAEENPNRDASDFEGVPQNIVQQQQQLPIFGLNQDNVLLTATEVVSALDASRLAQSVCQVHAAVLPRLSQFHDFLSTEPPLKPIPSTIGIIQRPLGAARIEAVHFIRALLSSNNPSINRALAAHKTLTVLINLFFKYPWNSFLHTQVEQSIKLIFINSKASSPVTSPTEDGEAVSKKPEDGSSQEAAALLVQELIQETCLIEDIPRIWSMFNQRVEGSNIELPVSVDPRPGYMGHLIKIANDINDASVTDESVRCLIDGLSVEKKEAWQTFVEGSLVRVNERMKVPLVPEVPATIFENEASQRQESVLHQAFIAYQMQQMTKDSSSETSFDTSAFREVNQAMETAKDAFNEHCFQRSVQLSRLNFDLDDETAQVQKPSGIQKDDNENSSSDEEELWPDKSPQQPSQVMEVDVVNPWPAPVSQAPPSDPWSGSNDANHADAWADFGSFESQTSDITTQPMRDSTSATSVIVSNVAVQPIDSEARSDIETATSSQIPETLSPEAMKTGDEALLGSAPL